MYFNIFTSTFCCIYKVLLLYDIHQNLPKKYPNHRCYVILSFLCDYVFTFSRKNLRIKSFLPTFLTSSKNIIDRQV